MYAFVCQRKTRIEEQKEQKSKGQISDLFTLDQVAQLSLGVVIVQCDFFDLAGQV